MDKTLFVDRILETENLTDEMEDAGANRLLDWGVSQLDDILQGAKNDKLAGDRVNALMAVMRKINRIMGSYAGQNPQDLAADLLALNVLVVASFGHTPRKVTGLNAAEADLAAANLSQLSTPQALEFLTHWSFLE